MQGKAVFVQGILGDINEPEHLFLVCKHKHVKKWSLALQMRSPVQSFTYIINFLNSQIEI